MVEQRKLTTIMSIDVAGYSRAMEVVDGAAAEAVGALRHAIEDVTPLGGRIFNSAGDGFMIEFPVVSSGARAALTLLSKSNAGAKPLPKIRIGLHLGEVIVGENGDLLGHGVNVAARLQAKAAPGTAMVSQAVQSQLRQAADIPSFRSGASNSTSCWAMSRESLGGTARAWITASRPTFSSTLASSSTRASGPYAPIRDFFH